MMRQPPGNNLSAAQRAAHLHSVSPASGISELDGGDPWYTAEKTLGSVLSAFMEGLAALEPVLKAAKGPGLRPESPLVAYADALENLVQDVGPVLKECSALRPAGLAVSSLRDALTQASLEDAAAKAAALRPSLTRELGPATGGSVLCEESWPALPGKPMDQTKLCVPGPDPSEKSSRTIHFEEDESCAGESSYDLPNIRRSQASIDLLSNSDRARLLQVYKHERSVVLREGAVDFLDLCVKSATLLHFFVFFYDSQRDYVLPMSLVYCMAVFAVCAVAVARLLDLREVGFVVNHGFSKHWRLRTSQAGGLDPRVERDADTRELNRLRNRTLQAVFADLAWIVLLILRTLIYDSDDDSFGLQLSVISQVSAGFNFGKKYQTIREYCYRFFVKREHAAIIYEELPAFISVGSSASELESTKAAIDHTWQSLRHQIGSTPSYLFVTMTCNHDIAAGLARLRELAPGVPFSGTTTCQGVIHKGRSRRQGMRCVGLWGIHDPEGAYYVDVMDVAEDPQEIGRRVVQEKLRTSRWIGETLPSFVLVNPCPGSEDRLIAGMSGALGSKVPLFGGTSGDNSVVGEWRQWACDGTTAPLVKTDGCAFAFCYCSAVVQGGLFTGYNPTGHTGIVTKCDARHILEVDHKQAAVVYNEWTGGELSKEMEVDDANLLGVSSLYPVGQKCGECEGEPFYRVMHPHLMKKSTKSFTVFSDVKVGEPLTMMAGTVDNIVNRIAQVSTSVIQKADFSSQEVRGALVFFCAGCMMYLSDKTEFAAKKLDDSLGGVPHLGVHTFGETGPFPDGKSRHGNLMFSAMIFSSRRRIMKVVNVDSGETTMESDEEDFMKLVDSGVLNSILKARYTF